jgi:hypothetical protein
MTWAQRDVTEASLRRGRPLDAAIRPNWESGSACWGSHVRLRQRLAGRSRPSSQDCENLLFHGPLSGSATRQDRIPPARDRPPSSDFRAVPVPDECCETTPRGQQRSRKFLRLGIGSLLDGGGRPRFDSNGGFSESAAPRRPSRASRAQPRRRAADRRARGSPWRPRMAEDFDGRRVSQFRRPVLATRQRDLGTSCPSTRKRKCPGRRQSAGASQSAAGLRFCGRNGGRRDLFDGAPSVCSQVAQAPGGILAGGHVRRSLRSSRSGSTPRDGHPPSTTLAQECATGRRRSGAPARLSPGRSGRSGGQSSRFGQPPKLGRRRGIRRRRGCRPPRRSPGPPAR